MATLMLKPKAMATSTIPTKDGWYTVTPDVATEWEATGVNIRNYSLDTINQYARDMRNGHWDRNGEPMQFDEDGVMINGYHRARACIAAQTPFVTYVIVGLPRGTKTFDLGYKRSHGQILKISGEHYGNYIAAAARLLWKYERGPRALLDNRARPSLHDVYDVLEAHPTLKESVELCAGSFQKVRQLTRSASVPTLIHYIGSRKHGEKATDFLELIHRGVDPESGVNRAAYMLRERLSDWARIKVRATQVDYLGLWIPAWNAYAKGKTIRTLRPLDWSGDAPGSKIE